MSHARIRKISNVLFGLAALALVSAWAPMAICMLNGAQGTGDAAALATGDDAHLSDAHLGDDAHPDAAALTCAERHPLSASTSSWLLLSLGLVGGTLTRMFAGSSRYEQTRSAARKPPVRQPAPRLAPAEHHSLDGHSLDHQAPDRAGPDALPDAIDVGEDFDLGLGTLGRHDDAEDTSDTMMAFVEAEASRSEHARRDASPHDGAPHDADDAGEETIDGFYCPPGMLTAAVLYVDRRHGDDHDRADHPRRPFASLDAALASALQLITTPGTRVQIRLMPGVYQASVHVPDRVVLVNHRMPAGSDVLGRLGWLAEQTEIDHPDRVTILAPPERDCAVQFLPGRLQGLFGCHLVGRDGVEQHGVQAAANMALAIVNCVVEGFSLGGAHLRDCGEEYPGRPTTLAGCIFRSNASPRGGGALHVDGGAMRVLDCAFENNTAPAGGAILARGLRTPLLVERCTLQRNRAVTRTLPRDPLLQFRLADWPRAAGLGGAIVAIRSLLKVVDCHFAINDAALAGGAIAALASRVVVHSEAARRSCAFAENRARLGGAIALVGLAGEGGRCLLKTRDILIHNCVARDLGGALGLVGFAAAQLDRSSFEHNRCSDEGSLGGAIFVHKGALLQARRLSLQHNTTRAHGGAIAALNASVHLAEGCRLERNTAHSGEGGGIYAMTAIDTDMADLLGSGNDAILPFTLTLADVAIEHNHAGGEGGGLRAGNDEPAPTFPLSLELARPDAVWKNTVAPGINREAADVWITWAHLPRLSSRDKLPTSMLLN